MATQDLQSKELPTTRIQPDRRWFGNTRVIGQKQLEQFRTEMASKVNDAYTVLLKEKKLPLQLLEDPEKKLKGKQVSLPEGTAVEPPARALQPAQRAIASQSGGLAAALEHAAGAAVDGPTAPLGDRGDLSGGGHSNLVACFAAAAQPAGHAAVPGHLRLERQAQAPHAQGGLDGGAGGQRRGARGHVSAQAVRRGQEGQRKQHPRESRALSTCDAQEQRTAPQ